MPDDLNGFLEILPLPSFIVRNGYLCRANSKMVQVTGLTLEMIIETPFARFIHRDDQDRVLDSAMRCQRGGDMPEPCRFRAVDGTGEEVYLKGFFSLLQYKGRPAALVQIINITRPEIAERRLAREKLRESEQKYRLVFENAPLGIFHFDKDGFITAVNDNLVSIIGSSREALMGLDTLKLPDGQVADGIKKALSGGQGKFEGYYRSYTSGKVTCVKADFAPVMADDGSVAGGVGIVEDITERIKARDQLRDIIEFLPDPTFVIDNDGKVIAWNRAIEEMSGVSKEEMIGRGDHAYTIPFYGVRRPALIDFIFSDRDRVINYYENIHIKGDTLFAEAYVPLPAKGKGAYVWVKASPLYDREGSLVGAVESIRDITDRKEMEERLKYLSLHDWLTGLYNRAYFEEEIRRFEGGRQVPIGIILCDVDGLKLVNDTLGHRAGDALLIAAANVCRDSFRAGDMVARVGGDEFAVLLPNTDRSGVEKASRRIRDNVVKHNKSNPDLSLSLSVGFAVSADPSVKLGNLFKEADNSMYREKLHHSQSARSAIVQTLMKALEARDFITEGHADRIQGLVADMASAIGLSERSITDLRLLAQFHDIGKVGIPDRLLFKPGPLDEEEFSEMKRHSEIGCRIAQSAPDLVPIADWILKHHEWWNGSGYPLGLAGEEIPLECRILSIADAYDAMTSDRPYRKAMSVEEAVSELKRCAGVQFDPDLVDMFIDILENDQ